MTKEIIAVSIVTVTLMMNSCTSETNSTSASSHGPRLNRPARGASSSPTITPQVEPPAFAIVGDGVSPAINDAVPIESNQVDRFALDAVHDDAVEAREWLGAHPSRELGALADGFYRLGAVRVWLASFEPGDESSFPTELVIELPSDIAMRQALIVQFVSAAQDADMDDPMESVGERFAVLELPEE
jgi:hypothetical protein